MKRLFLALWIVLLMVGSGWAGSTPKFFYASSLPTGAATRYGSICGSMTVNATQGVRRTVYAGSGTLSGFRFKVSADPGAGNSLVFTLMKKAAGGAWEATNIAVTITSSNWNTPQTDPDGDTVSYSTGDCFEMRVVGTGTPAASTLSAGYIDTSPTDAICLHGTQTANSATDPIFVGLIGLYTGAPNTTENYTQVIVPFDGTITIACAELASAPGAVASGKQRDYKVRVNGADPVNQLTFTIFETATSGNDTTPTMAVSAGDKISFVDTPTNSPTVSLVTAAISIVPTIPGNFMIPITSCSDIMRASSGTRYCDAWDYYEVQWAASPLYQLAPMSYRLTALYSEVTVAPDNGAGTQSWAFTPITSTADKTDLTTTISEAATTASTTGKSVSIYANDMVGMKLVTTGSPVGNSRGMVSLLGMANTFFTTYAKNKVLNHVCKVASYTPEAPYLALFTADPTSAGSTASEATYTSYARQPITFSAASSRGVTQSGQVNFPTATAGSDTITYWGLMEQTSGNMIAYGSFAASKAVSTGKTPVVASGEVIVQFASGGISTAYSNSVLDWLFRGQALAQPTHIYAALCSDASSDASIGTELSGNAYARAQADSWSTSTLGETSNSSAITFPTATPAGWTAAVSAPLLDDASNYMFYGTTSLTVPAGSTGRFSAGQLQISIP